MEVRKRRPKYGVVESFHLNDVANVVAGSVVREEPFRIRTSKQGIDFVHDGTNRVRIHAGSVQVTPLLVVRRQFCRGQFKENGSLFLMMTLVVATKTATTKMKASGQL